MSADSLARGGGDSKGRHIYALRVNLQRCRHNGNQRGLHVDSTRLQAIRAHVIQSIYRPAAKHESCCGLPDMHGSAGCLGKVAAMHEAAQAANMVSMSGTVMRQLVTPAMIPRSGQRLLKALRYD